MTGAEAGALFAEIAAELPPVIQESRAVLLGTRDPNGKSCLRFVPLDELEKAFPPRKHGDLNGGPGMRLYELCIWEDKSPLPTDEYAWMQVTLRRDLERTRDRSRAVSAKLAPLAAKTRRLSAWFECCKAPPKGFAAPAMLQASDWPSFCLARTAERAGGAEWHPAKLWSHELESALFALEDLHRWLEFLCENQLSALDFQELCAEMFDEADGQYAPATAESLAEANRQPTDSGPEEDGKERYDSRQCISRFAGGSPLTSLIYNMMEVERQAEGLFRSPAPEAAPFAGAPAEPAGGCPRPLDVPAAPRPAPAAALWMPPDVRGTFAQLRAVLSPANQALWDQAAAMPYERSFMGNHLYRLQTAGVVEQAGKALEQYDKLHPRGTVAELMDVLVYRAGLGMAGLSWGDRFDARLVIAGQKVAELCAAKGEVDRAAGFAEAHKFQYGVYGGGHNYKGLVLTLRQALNTGQMDCIRGTDMIAAAYRNAGLPGFLGVRWVRGTSGHTIGAVEVVAPPPAGDSGGTARPGSGERTAGRQVVTRDSLFSPERGVEVWPDAYMTRHRDIYAAELNGRGLDNYVFLQGYVSKGRSAGTLFKSPVPYLPGWTEDGVEQVGAGR